jgi:hypothetical protein
MGRMCVAGHQNFGCKELEECGIKWERMAGNSEEGQGPQRAVSPMMMMIVGRQKLRKNITAAMHTHEGIEPRRFLCGPRRIKERKRLVFPRIYCFFNLF